MSLEQQQASLLHPILVDLGIVADEEDTRTGARTAAAVDILQYLLDSDQLSEQSLRDAHRKATTGGVVAAVDEQVEGGADRNSSNEQQQQQHKEEGNPQPQVPKEHQPQQGEVAPSTQTTASATATKKAPPPEEARTAATAVVNSNSMKRKRHIALKIYYDGAKYTGLAEQVGLGVDDSIEKHLFAALAHSKLIDGDRYTCRYSRCGRTDKGVSSNGQVVAFELNSAFAEHASLDEDGQVPLRDEDLPRNGYDAKQVWMVPRSNGSNRSKKRRKKNNDNNSDNNTNNDNGQNGDSTAAAAAAAAEPPKRCQRVMAEYAYDKILNNLLPNDIRVFGWCPVSDDFSARFSTTYRTYRYFFVRRRLDLDRMRLALQHMVGTHDFRNFCKMNVEAVSNFERKILRASLVEEGGEGGVCYFEILGQAFLWHQIRCIASVLFLVGRHTESPGIVSELLDVQKHPGKPGYPLADAEPLVLHDCAYHNLQVGYSCQNLWMVRCQQEEQWEEWTLAAARVGNAMESLKDDAQVLVGDLAAFVDTKLKERNRKKGKRKLAEPATGAGAAPPPFQSEFVSWREALDWMRDAHGLVPEPYGANKKKEQVHTALLERSRGSTYEEKVAAVKQHTKRNQRYEENVVRKRTSKEENLAFYQHMAKQGTRNS